MSNFTEFLKDEAVRLVVEKQPKNVSSKEITSHPLFIAAFHIENLQDALEEMMKITMMGAQPAQIDPQYGKAVASLGSQVGFGVVMMSASAAWREDLKNAGYPTGGEFAVGPCVSTLQFARKRATDALDRVKNAKK